MLLVAYSISSAFVSSWTTASMLCRYSIFFVGPGSAGIAVWAAGRDRRYGLDDFLTTLPCPAWMRWGSRWSAVTLWCVASYVAVCACIEFVAVRQVSWGTPVLWPLVVGLATIPAYSAIGYVLGTLLSWPLIAPLVVVAAFLCSVAMTGSGPAPDLSTIALWHSSNIEALRYLFPLAPLNASPWYGIQPAVAWPELLCLLGVTLAALSIRAFHDSHRALAWGGLLSGGILTGLAASILFVTAPPSAVVLNAIHDSGTAPTSLMKYQIVSPYTPYCLGKPVPVCVHPSTSSTVRIADGRAINQILAPLRGLPGSPTKAAQRPLGGRDRVVGQTLLFDPSLEASSSSNLSFFQAAAGALVANASGHARVCPNDASRRSCQQTQDALSLWLLRRTNNSLTQQTAIELGYTKSAVVVAMHFEMLGQARQHAWLRLHYQAVRQGVVPLGDLP